MINLNYPKNSKIINNIFQFKNGDILQICEGGIWTDVGTINNSRAAALAMNSSGHTVLGLPARVVRR